VSAAGRVCLPATDWLPSGLLLLVLVGLFVRLFARSFSGWFARSFACALARLWRPAANSALISPYFFPRAFPPAARL